MSVNEQDKQQEAEQNKDAGVKPDPETLHTTDPQDEMKGPVSSLVQGVKKGMEDADKDTPKEENS